LISREKTIDSLLNRLQSGDLKTLLSLQATVDTPATPDYLSTHDQKELEIISQSQGLGIELYDDGSRDSDEFDAFKNELGLP
jgi:hypothetical protein